LRGLLKLGYLISLLSLSAVILIWIQKIIILIDL